MLPALWSRNLQMLSLPRSDGITPASPLRPPQAVPPAPLLLLHPASPPEASPAPRSPAPRKATRAEHRAVPKPCSPAHTPAPPGSPRYARGRGDLHARPAEGPQRRLAAHLPAALLQCPPRRRQPGPATAPAAGSPAPADPGGRGGGLWFEFRPSDLK